MTTVGDKCDHPRRYGQFRHGNIWRPTLRYSGVCRFECESPPRPITIRKRSLRFPYSISGCQMRAKETATPLLGPARSTPCPRRANPGGGRRPAAGGCTRVPAPAPGAPNPRSAPGRCAAHTRGRDPAIRVRAFQCTECAPGSDSEMIPLYAPLSGSIRPSTQTWADGAVVEAPRGAASGEGCRNDRPQGGDVG